MFSKILNLHHSCADSKAQVSVEYKIEKSYIEFHFCVQNIQCFNTNPKFSHDYKENWGLWENDVVEIFIKKEDSESYLEFQVTPLGQPFALIIDKPRVSFYPPQELNIEWNVILDNDFKASIKIPFSDIPGHSNILVGNCFACLEKEPRSFHALNINLEDAPDFHRPELFIKFGEIL